MNKEKKTYKNRISTILISITLIVLSILTFDVYKYGICKYETYCIFDGWRFSISEPLFLMSVGLFVVSVFIFFISDKIFKKWLKFTFWYFLISAIWIMISPESSGSFMEILATKEQVSTFASVMFVIISLIMFIWLTIKEKKNK